MDATSFACAAKNSAGAHHRSFSAIPLGSESKKGKALPRRHGSASRESGSGALKWKSSGRNVRQNAPRAAALSVESF
jgi:hypothetical protein